MFRSIIASYYRGANGIMLVYDVTDEASFQNVGDWMDNIRTQASKSNPAVVLVGNKVDLTGRVVATEAGEAAAAKFGAPFFETSAKSGFMIHEMVRECAKGALDSKLFGGTPQVQGSGMPSGGGDGGGEKKCVIQ